MKSWLFEKINNVDKPQSNLPKTRMEKTQINKIRNEKGVITTKSKEIQGIIKEENVYSNKLENLEEMNICIWSSKTEPRGY
jgi:hypothetical protein